MSEVYARYVDTAGNYHYTDTETGHHVIRKSCGYCHEDFVFPNRIDLKFGNEYREFKTKYCPICGRKLDGET